MLSLKSLKFVILYYNGVSADFCWHVLAALTSPGCRMCGQCISQSEDRAGITPPIRRQHAAQPWSQGPRLNGSSSHLTLHITLPALHSTHCQVPVTDITRALGRGNWPETHTGLTTALIFISSKIDKSDSNNLFLQYQKLSCCEAVKLLSSNEKV